VGDLRSSLAAGVTRSVAGASLLSPSIIIDASSPAPCWAGGGLTPVTTSQSSDSEESTPPVEVSSSSVDLGVGGGGTPYLRALAHALSWFSFLSLFLKAISFALSFLFFTTSACRRFASRTSGSGGFETLPLWLSPCKHDQIKNKKKGKKRCEINDNRNPGLPN